MTMEALFDYIANCFTSPDTNLILNQEVEEMWRSDREGAEAMAREWTQRFASGHSDLLKYL